MPHRLTTLEAQIKEELNLIEYPPQPWLANSEPPVFDVVIIGGGMAGLAVAFALKRQGIHNIKVFDACPEGFEGPWATYARMLILRSHKNLVGPALDIPKLTFHAWFSAQYGEEEWEKLYKIPTFLWMDYLRWYRHILALPVQNGMKVNLIEPLEDVFKLTMETHPNVVARKVILATGRGGFGGLNIPSLVQDLPKNRYAHTSESIDFELLSGKAIGILGVGSSAFDAAAEALEQGAASVTILMRRKNIPHVNKFASTTYPGVSQGFYLLPDEAKVKIIRHAFEAGSPPPFESLDRVKEHSNFRVIPGIDVQQIVIDHEVLSVSTNLGTHHFDYLILATGYAINGHKQPELRAIIDEVLLWKERIPTLSSTLGAYPYLGNHYQFLGKKPASAGYLKNIYCFNYAATLSQGLTSSDIPDISTGAQRLAKGIAADFFTQQWPEYLKRLEQFDRIEFYEHDYPFINV